MKPWVMTRMLVKRLLDPLILINWVEHDTICIYQDYAVEAKAPGAFCFAYQAAWPRADQDFQAGCRLLPAV